MVRFPAGFVRACLVVAGLVPYGAVAAPAAGVIRAIGVENEYADVISQIGGRYVSVHAIETDPNTDPHNFEASPRIAAAVAEASLIVTNGAGYDDWANRIMAAAPNPARHAIRVQRLLGLPDAVPNPHLWYDPRTMPVVAKAVGDALSALLPSQSDYFAANVAKFDASLAPWKAAIASFKADFPDTPVAVTEPVANDMLAAAGAVIRTPFGLQAAIMNGTDPSPQDVTRQGDLLTGHAVKVLVYNQQVTDSLTNSFLLLAKRNAIPVVGVYETMPSGGFTYQGWMLAEVAALRRAVTDHVSTEKLEAGP